MNPNDIFWLARYAHNTMAPLVAAARQYDPSAYFKIEVTFAASNGEYPTRDNLSLNVFGRDQEKHTLLVQSYTLTTKAQVDQQAAKLQAWIDAEQAKLEAAHDAAVSYSIAPLETGIAA